jgi:hypothetical protein
MAKTFGKVRAQCWKGYHAVGTKVKNGRTVPNCVPVVEQGWESTHAQNPPETSSVPKKPKFLKLKPTIAANFKQGVRQTVPEAAEVWDKPNPVKNHSKLSASDKARAKARAQAAGRSYPNMVDNIWAARNEQTDIDEASPAWARKEGKNPTGGLNQKGIASYRREHPGSKLSMAVTTPPSKLDPDSKAAKRRKSFCARMGGSKGPMKKPNGEPTRKALALRKWNCHENFQDGRNPEDKGSMARYGLKGKSIAQLKAVRSSDSASPRAKQLAHWFINMHQKKN